MYLKLLGQVFSDGFRQMRFRAHSFGQKFSGKKVSGKSLFGGWIRANVLERTGVPPAQSLV